MQVVRWLITSQRSLVPAFCGCGGKFSRTPLRYHLWTLPLGSLCIFPYRVEQTRSELTQYSRAHRISLDKRLEFVYGPTSNVHRFAHRNQITFDVHWFSAVPGGDGCSASTGVILRCRMWSCGAIQSHAGSHHGVKEAPPYMHSGMYAYARMKQQARRSDRIFHDLSIQYNLQATLYACQCFAIPECLVSRSQRAS